MTEPMVLDIYCTTDPGDRAHDRGGDCWCKPEQTTFEPPAKGLPATVVIDHYAEPAHHVERSTGTVDNRNFTDSFEGRPDVECCGRTFSARGYHNHLRWHTKQAEVAS